MPHTTYNVVFQYTDAARGYSGIITWTSFRDQADFIKWYSPEIERKQSVIAQGVTPAQAVELVATTPVACYAAAGLQDVFDAAEKVGAGTLLTRLVKAAAERSMRN